MAVNFLYIVCFVIILVKFISGDEYHGSLDIKYTEDSFNRNVANGIHFIMFFAPWCGHCKRLSPIWSELSSLINGVSESMVTIAKVDCTTDTALCAGHKVTAYPTLKYFKGLDNTDTYRGSRDLDSLKAFIEEKSAEADDDGDLEGKNGPMYLTDKSFAEFTKDGLHFVNFYVPWSQPYRQLSSTWYDLAQSFHQSGDTVFISEVDCDIWKELCLSNKISTYPTLLLFNNGLKIEEYIGELNVEALGSFVKKTSSDLQSAAGEELQDLQNDDEEKPLMEDVLEKGRSGFDLSDDTFYDTVASGMTFVMFFAPWCSHCKHLAPTWQQLGDAYRGKDVKVAQVDCTKFKDTCSDHQVHGYPTLLLFQNGVILERYNGDRSLKALLSFIDGHKARIEL